MKKRLIDICDYAALFGAICLIPTGADGALVLPLWASLSLVGIGGSGRLGFVAFNLLAK